MDKNSGTPKPEVEHPTVAPESLLPKPKRKANRSSSSPTIFKGKLAVQLPGGVNIGMEISAALKDFEKND